MIMRAIKSIVKIKNFPSFIDFKPTSDLQEFSKYNLLYGWNGSGKTTFSRILRTFEMGENSHDKTTTPAEYEFKLSDGSSISKNDPFGFKEIRVFNKDFTEESIFCDGGPRSIFFLGKENKEDQEKIKKSEEELGPIAKELAAKQTLLAKVKDSNEKALSARAREIKNALTTALVDKYRNYEKDALIKAIKDYAFKLKNLSELLLDDDSLTRLKKSILETSGKSFSSLPIPDLDLSGLLKEVENILKKVISSKVIESLKTDDEISKWVRHGFNIHRTKRLTVCAFCNQTIPTDRLADLEGHFNDEYQKTIQAIQSLKQKCAARSLSVALPDSSNLYADLAPEFLIEKQEAEKAIKAFSNVLKKFIEALEQKEQNPFTEPIIQQFSYINNDAFVRINQIIGKHNEKTNNFEQQVVVGKEKLELHYIAGFLPSHNSAVTEYVNLTREIGELETRIKTKELKIKNLKESLITHHVPAREINEGLEKFLGRSDIQLKATEAEDGYQIIRNGEAARNLSEGEKTALAIVYFTIKIREDGFDLKNSVIVIDDPVSSLDSSSIFQAFSFLKESIKDAGQIFILTHHFDFFRQVKNWFCHCKKDEKAFFMVVCRVDAGTRKSQIRKIDRLLIDFESEYHFLFNLLYSFSENKQTDLEQMYPLPNVARKFLESFLAFRVPIGSKEPNIRERLGHIRFEETKKTRINRFVETHSHPRYEAGVQDFDMTIIGETPAIIADLLQMVQVEDRRHYDFLVQSLA